MHVQSWGKCRPAWDVWDQKRLMESTFIINGKISLGSGLKWCRIHSRDSALPLGIALWPQIEGQAQGGKGFEPPLASGED